MVRSFAFLAVAAAMLRGQAAQEQATARAALELLASVEPDKAQPEAASKPKVVSAEQQEKVMEQLEKLAVNMQANAKQIKVLDAKDMATHISAANLTHTMSAADKKMWDNFDDWNHRMNQKTEVRSLDVVSKIKKAMHFIKKGAMSGDAKAAEQLQDVIKSMGMMAR